MICSSNDTDPNVVLRYRKYSFFLTLVVAVEGSLKIYGLLKPRGRGQLHLASDLNAILAVDVALIFVGAVNIFKIGLVGQVGFTRVYNFYAVGKFVI